MLTLRSSISSLALAVSLTSAGCGGMFPDYSVKHAVNPAADKAPVASVWFAPAVDCSMRAEPDDRLRLWLTETLVPSVIRQAGGQPSTVVKASSSKTCQVLYDDFLEGRSEWHDPLQGKIADSLLQGHREDYVFVVLFAVTRICEERKLGVENTAGNKVGAIGTGKYDCYEKSTFEMTAHLMKRDGDRVYSAWLPLWVEEQERNYTPQMAAKLGKELLASYPGPGASQ